MPNYTFCVADSATVHLTCDNIEDLNEVVTLTADSTPGTSPAEQCVDTTTSELTVFLTCDADDAELRDTDNSEDSPVIEQQSEGTPANLMGRASSIVQRLDPSTGELTVLRICETDADDAGTLLNDSHEGTPVAGEECFDSSQATFANGEPQLPSELQPQQTVVSVESAADDPDITDEVVQGSRKRTRNEANWLCNKRKKLRNSGCMYVNKNNKMCKGRSIRPLPSHGSCRRKCCEKVTEDDRAALFNGFWQLANFDAQNVFLSRSVRQQGVKRRRPRPRPNKTVHSANPKKKNRLVFDKAYSRAYYVNVGGCDVSVCKEFFLATFDISSGRVTRAIAQLRASGGVSPGDRRGRYDHCKQRLPSDAVDRVKAHINSFPAYISHYTRSQSRRKYLSSDLNLCKMYKLYEEQCKNDGIQPVKVWAYRQIFNSSFNLYFHQPDKDTCKKCDKFKAELSSPSCTGDNKRVLECQHELHLRKAEKARSCLKADSENPVNQLSDSEPVVKRDVITFDLQKVMPIPSLSTNEAYYCRQLSVYNLGIHSMTRDHVIMNVWPETTASRGADEIGSCLLNYCNQISAQGITHLTAYSDSCGGQNRNIKMVAMWLYITQSTAIDVVDHKFMVSGHSFLPNDTDFGLIERAKLKTTEIYVPEQWYSIIEKCCKKRPFEVNRMNSVDFQSTKPLLNAITNRKICNDGQKVRWLDIQWIRIQKDKPFVMQFKCSMSDDLAFSCVSLAKRGRPRSLAAINLPLLYKSCRPVSKEKYADLKKLLKYVPPVHHEFYEHIKRSGQDADEVLEDEYLQQSEEEDGETA